MLLLAFDTATPLVSVALHDGVRPVAAAAPAVDARRHGELLAPAIAQVLADVGAQPGDLTGVAVGVGPGPFTGLRVGLVTAQTLGLTLDVPVYGVGTLDALAWQAAQTGLTGEYVVATDARRSEVYWAGYRLDPAPGLPLRRSDPDVRRASAIDLQGRPVVGRGALLYPDDLGLACGPLDPTGAAVAGWALGALAAGQDLSELAPQYLRRPDIHAGGPRKSVLG
jgi:tRNA threonylcarbamoyladenosine biosynthesis protein TsaB